MADESLPRPPEEELASSRLMIEAANFEFVSDQIREFVEQYLPDLKDKLPPKPPTTSGPWFV
jgi:hypothetical protein